MPPDTTDVDPRPGRRRVTVIVVGFGVATIGVAAATAGMLLRAEDGTEAAPPAETTTAMQARAPTQETAPGPGRTTRKLAGSPAAETSTGSEQSRPRAGAAPARPMSGPEKALREHWRAIDGGDYVKAYARFSSRYRRSHSLGDWSSGIGGFGPRVEVVEIREIASAGGRASVRVIVATRDRGVKGDARRCHIFRGRVDVVREGGMWRYDPPGLREVRRGGVLPSSDARCAALF